MTDLQMLEEAMRKAWKHQLGFVFNQRYLQHRAEGQTVHSSIRLFEQEFKLNKPEASQRPAGLSGYLVSLGLR